MHAYDLFTVVFLSGCCLALISAHSRGGRVTQGGKEIRVQSDSIVVCLHPGPPLLSYVF